MPANSGLNSSTFRSITAKARILRPVLVGIFGVGTLRLVGQRALVHFFEGVADVLEEDQAEDE